MPDVPDRAAGGGPGGAPSAAVVMTFPVLERTASDLLDDARRFERLRRTVVDGLGSSPPGAFGLVAESGDAVMAYRRRLGALNTESEAAQAESVGMSDALSAAVRAVRQHSAASAGALGHLQRSLDRWADGSAVSPDGN